MMSSKCLANAVMGYLNIRGRVIVNKINCDLKAVGNFSNETPAVNYLKIEHITYPKQNCIQMNLLRWFRCSSRSTALLVFQLHTADYLDQV